MCFCVIQSNDSLFINDKFSYDFNDEKYAEQLAKKNIIYLGR